jgi:hydroxyacylglutathione hydrolase
MDHLSFAGEEVIVMDASGHTDVHIAFYFPTSGVLFSADSLMTLSCGRVSGTIDQMKATFDRFAALPDHTKVYSGHEYSAVNSAFALTIEPDNAALTDRVDRLRQRRDAGQPTVPNTIGDEKATNPFFRTHIESVKQASGAKTDQALDVFTEIRTLRNKF